jgi:pimeloyl-ACP methyl ester carboxylesterase/DNA-binding CsgD family transcriptional regulator
MDPETRYAKSGSLSIAFSTCGDGPLDLLMVPGFISHLEYAWREPSLARFLRKLSSFLRVIMFDKRGMGLSDRLPAGATRVVLFAWSEGGPLSIRIAAADPGRVAALVLVGTTPRFRSGPDFPEGAPQEILEMAIEAWEEEWGTGVALELYGPSVADDQRVRSWWAAYQRFAATPGAVAATLRLHLAVDVRDFLPHVRAPTLIIHRTDDMLVPVTCARYMAERILGARYVELEGSDHMYWLGDQDEVLYAVKSFLADMVEDAPLERMKQRRRRRPAAGWESLTDAELDVVRLVAEGLTNREIAARLFVSPRTVQTHLGHVFAKLGLSHRAEVAAETARRLT